MTPTRVVVLGVGNPWRMDDGAGVAVARAVRSLAGDGVDVIELDGEASRIVDAWRGAALAVVVDAVRTGSSPGTLHRLDTDEIAGPPSASSHGLGVDHAVSLGRALGQLPERLVLFGVEGTEFGHGEQLSAAVEAAVQPAAQLIIDLVHEHG